MTLFQSGKTSAVLFFISALFFGDLFGSAGIPVIPNGKVRPPMDGKFDAEQWKDALKLKLPLQPVLLQDFNGMTFQRISAPY